MTRHTNESQLIQENNKLMNEIQRLQNENNMERVSHVQFLVKIGHEINRLNMELNIARRK